MELAIAGGDGLRRLELRETVAGRARIVATADLGESPVTLELRAGAREYTAAGGTGGSVSELGSVATRELSAETITARSGRHYFTGAMLGLVATGNGRRSTAPADFDWFEYDPA